MEGNHKFDLEERTLAFAKQSLALSRSIPINVENVEMKKQFIRSAMSIGANYREANESLTPKDFVHKIGIVKKEAKECLYWLNLIGEMNDNAKIANLIDEVRQLIKIFQTILDKYKVKKS